MSNDTLEIVCYVEIGRFPVKTVTGTNGETRLVGLTPEEKTLLNTADHIVAKELDYPTQPQ